MEKHDILLVPVMCLPFSPVWVCARAEFGLFRENSTDQFRVRLNTKIFENEKKKHCFLIDDLWVFVMIGFDLWVLSSHMSPEIVF